MEELKNCGYHSPPYHRGSFFGHEKGLRIEVPYYISVVESRITIIIVIVVIVNIRPIQITLCVLLHLLR